MPNFVDMAAITDINSLDPNGIYSYADYLKWEFKERVELIKGRLLRLSPAPGRRHQRIASNLYLPIGQYLKNQKCQAYFALFDVRLHDSAKKQNIKDHQIFTVIQPDICVICDAAKLDEKGCIGAPDWIIEIISPGNSKREVKNKFRLYEENEVPYFWMVFPSEDMLQAFAFIDGKMQLTDIWTEDDVASCPLFPDLIIPLHEVFQE